jgi:hypothetical protein
MHVARLMEMKRDAFERVSENSTRLMRKWLDWMFIQPSRSTIITTSYTLYTPVTSDLSEYLVYVVVVLDWIS